MNKAKRVISLIEDDDAAAFQRKDSLRALDSLQFEIIQHLLKLLLFPDDSAQTKWVTELEAWRSTLSRKNKGKGGANNYDKKILNKSLWVEPLDEPSDRDLRLKELKDDGYSVVSRIETKVPQLKELVNKFIDCVLDSKKFTI